MRGQTYDIHSKRESRHPAIILLTAGREGVEVLPCSCSSSPVARYSTLSVVQTVVNLTTILCRCHGECGFFKFPECPYFLCKCAEFDDLELGQLPLLKKDFFCACLLKVSSSL